MTYSNQNTATSAAAPTSQGIDLNQQTAGDQAQTVHSEWDWVNEGLTLPVTLATTSEVVSKLDAALLAIMKPGAKQEVKLLSIDNTVETNWRYSVAVLTVYRPEVNWLGFYPMLIEATENRPLTAVQLRVGPAQNQMMIPVQPVPSDGLNTDYLARIEQLLVQSYPNAQALHVQGTVIPKTVNFEDIEQLKRILLTATKACFTQLAEIDTSFVDNNLSLVNKSSQTVTRLAVTSGAQGDVVNVVGLPTRQDIELTLVAVTPLAESGVQRSALQSAHELNGRGQTEERIGRLSAYIDTRVLPAPSALYNTDPLALTRRYVPELVITSVDLPKLATVASLMMMITQATAMAEPRILHSALYQRALNGRAQYANAAFDPSDLGALNYLSDLLRDPTQKPTAYDLKSSTVTGGEFVDYLQRVFVPGMAVSIDVPRLSVQSAYMTVLSKCAADIPESLAFFQGSLNKLTGGKFDATFFAATGGRGALTADMIFSERNNSLYNGYYIQKIGDQSRQVDIRHIDTVALQNRFGAQDPSIITKWAQSFLVNHVDPAIRMANKREVIAAYTNDSATITGISERHTFRTEFLAAIVACNVANHFKPVLDFSDSLGGMDTGLQAPGYMAGGLMTSGFASAFGTSGGATANYGGSYINPTAGRF